MTTPDAQEQGRTPTGDAAPPVAPEVPLEASEADVVEQATAVAPEGHRVHRELGLEVPEADALEQAQVEPLDEDEGRG